MRQQPALFGDTRGAAAVELAVAAPVIVLFLLGLLELAQMLWIDHTLQDAADSTARYAIVNRISDSAALSGKMSSLLQSSPGAAATVSVSQTLRDGISYLEIAGSLVYVPLSGLTGIPNVTLSGRAVVPIVGGS